MDELVVLYDACVLYPASLRDLRKEGTVMSNKALSTYEREMQDPEFKKEYKKHYRKLLLSELIIALMEKDYKSVHVLANECDVST